MTDTVTDAPEPDDKPTQERTIALTPGQLAVVAVVVIALIVLWRRRRRARRGD